MLYLPITKTWLVSDRARHVYLACAIATLCGVGVLIEEAIGFELSGIQQALIVITLLLGAVGAATLWVAMWYFWFTYESTESLRGLVWPVAFCLFAPIASTVYYFAVYRRVSKREGA